jgi:hypothetical protein
MEQVSNFRSVDLDHDAVKTLETVHRANDCTLFFKPNEQA